MTSPGDADLQVAADALKAAVDAWRATVEDIGDGRDSGGDALEDPRLAAAEEEFEAAVAAFHRASGPVLGLEGSNDDEADLEVEEIGLHLLVGVPAGEPDPARDAATIVQEGGQRLVAQLVSAGYEVPTWQVGCPTELLLDDEEDDDEDEEDDEEDDLEDVDEDDLDDVDEDDLDDDELDVVDDA